MPSLAKLLEVAILAKSVNTNKIFFIGICFLSLSVLTGQSYQLYYALSSKWLLKGFNRICFEISSLQLYGMYSKNPVAILLPGSKVQR
jgi:hypothetical protein